jgi:hypothetical protein
MAIFITPSTPGPAGEAGPAGAGAEDLSSVYGIPSLIGRSSVVLYTTRMLRGTSTGSLATEDGSIQRFTAKFTTALAGRTAKFCVLTNTGLNQFTPTWVSPDVNAAASGTLAYEPPISIPILTNQRIGVFSWSAAGTHADSFVVQQTGGNPCTDGGICEEPQNWNIVDSTPPAVGVQRTYNAPGQDAYCTIDAAYLKVISNDKTIPAKLGNKPGGAAIVGPDNKLSPLVLSTWSGKTIVGLGTSITAGQAGGQSYIARLSNLLSATIINEGSGESGICWNSTRNKSLSATVAEINALFPGWGSQSFETKVIPYASTAHLFIFDHGFNDTGYTVGAWGSTDRATFYGAYNHVINALLTANPQARFMFMTPFSMVHPTNQSPYAANILAVRAAILDMAFRYGAPVFDTAAVCGMNAYTRTFYTLGDNVHPTELWQARASAQLAKFIDSI